MEPIQSAAAQPAPVEISTTGLIYSWVDTPMAVALIFALAGAFFVGIYFLRRSRKS
ncbi:MAG: hypothetical protein LV479_00945 [Methylacidiphilales bacterium]|nr:hypothetical protein [Candidatus Methylacidiphilales bacterium]